MMAQASEMRATPPRVLVIDDDAMIRRLVARVLARAGFDVCTADDGAPGLRLAEVAPPDLVVVDYNMPTSGLEVVRALKKKYGEAIYVAVLTGEEHPATLDACRLAGADDVLAKPIGGNELLRRLTAAALRLKLLPAAS